ncbi:M91 family zinc metallopeptidase [Pseudomonas fildesensis]|uniref:M91 family zinc metallopeptidase n=1 Tax=Pseudomonas fildesensis TaxID=1674920 RepID=UPI00387AB31D
MLSSAHAYSAPTRNHSTPPAALDKPAPSPYATPSDLTPGRLNVKMHPLHVNGDVKISREIVWDPSDPNDPEIMSSRLVVETGNNADDIHVRSWPGGKLQIFVNGTPYLFNAEEQQGPPQGLWIKTKGGNDRIKIDDDVKIRVDVDAGDGDDQVQAGGGRTRLYGQGGNDVLRLGSGLGYAEGGDGDDTLMGGSGNNVMYGNKGNDRIYAGAGAATKQSHLDGGDGNDRLYAGNGHTVMHGGNDDDQLIGHDRTTFYTGKGHDRIWQNKVGDRVFANASDHFDRTRGSTFTPVIPSSAGEQGFTISVSPQDSTDFKQRVADDFEFLRSSPTGQQALTQMDALAGVNGGKVTVEPISFGGTSYVFDSAELEELAAEAEGNIDESALGVIKNGVPGSRADRATIYYDPPSTLESMDRSNISVPVTGLFHEIAHAYNGATGTFLSGETQESFGPDKSGPVENFERQAIGLPNDAQPFDLDNDPSTPPSTINPKPFTENALNEEMGKPLRNSYTLDYSEQGNGQ